MNQEKESQPHIISRVDAAEAGLTVYFTGIPCAKGHVSTRFVSCSVCTQCHRERDRSAEKTEAARIKGRERTRAYRARQKAKAAQEAQ